MSIHCLTNQLEVYESADTTMKLRLSTIGYLQIHNVSTCAYMAGLAYPVKRGSRISGRDAFFDSSVFFELSLFLLSSFWCFCGCGRAIVGLRTGKSDGCVESPYGLIV